MSLDWQWNEHAYVAVSEPFTLVVHDHETTFDYYVWDTTRPYDANNGPAAFGTVYSLERAFEAAESALFTIRMAQAKGWELWRSYLEPRGMLTPNTTPCTCRYCGMSETDIAAYRRAIRGIYGEGT